MMQGGALDVLSSVYFKCVHSLYNFVYIWIFTLWYGCKISSFIYQSLPMFSLGLYISIFYLLCLLFRMDNLANFYISLCRKTSPSLSLFSLYMYNVVIDVTWSITASKEFSEWLMFNPAGCVVSQMYSLKGLL